MEFIYNQHFEHIFLYFIIYSFFGWVYESLWSSFNEKEWVNRGFLSGPIIPIYGFGAVLFVLLLEDFNNVAVIFLLGMVIACVLEYFTSWAMEKLFHSRWWDYHHYPFNLNGRICLYGALLFGVFAVLINKVIQPYVESFVNSFNSISLYTISVIFMTLLITDTIITVKKVLHLKERMQSLQEAINSHKQEAEERFTEYKKLHAERKEQIMTNLRLEFEESGFYNKLKEKYGELNSHEVRLLKAFPNFSSNEFDEAVIRIKNKIAEKRSRGKYENL